MKHHRIVGGVLFLAGLAGLFALQYGTIVTEITPRPLLYLLADTQQEVERIPLAITQLSEEEENRIGRELARNAFSGLQKTTDPRVIQTNTYLRRVGGHLTRHVERKGIDYDFHFLPDTSVDNAWANPGGQVFVGQGLLERFESEDQLAAVLGHEIAHVDRRHAIERLRYQLQANKIGLGGLYQLGSIPVQLFQAGYSKTQELEADRTGLRLMVEAGYSPAGALDAIRRLETRPRPRRQARTPVGEAASTALEVFPEYFRSHPPPAERLAALEREIAVQRWNATLTQRPLALSLRGKTDGTQ